MGPLRKAVLACGVLLLTSLSSANAASVCTPASTNTYFSLETNDDRVGWCTSPIGSGFAVSYVTLVLRTAPVGKVRFSFPDPPFSTLNTLSWTFYYPFTGDHLTGMEMDLGCSGAGEIILGVAEMFTNGLAGCYSWKVDAGCEAEYCDGTLAPSMALPTIFTTTNFCIGCFQNCMGLPPYNLSPANGATGVPLNTPLSWEGPARDDRDTQCAIRIGKDPGCSDLQEIPASCDAQSVVLDFLEPSTTYYWRAGWSGTGGGCSSGDGGLSRVYSFTTAGPLATEATSWGRVKAMYRD
jgi:hypothetical protein